MIERATDAPSRVVDSPIVPDDSGCVPTPGGRVNRQRAIAA